MSLSYNPVNSSLQNLDLINSVAKKVPKRIFWDKIINKIYNWSYNHGYIDAFYETSLTKGIRGLVELTYFFYGRVKEYFLVIFFFVFTCFLGCLKIYKHVELLC